MVSFVLGLFQDFGPGRKSDQPRTEWVEGVAIMVGIVAVVFVGSLTNWQKERQLRSINAKKDERSVTVVRAGVTCRIDAHEVVVGDIALLEPGEIVPCDGVLLRGNNVRCDESEATGECAAIRKAEYAHCLEAHNRNKLRDANGEEQAGVDGVQYTDCFLISGSKVLEGVGSYVVIAVGQRSFNGRVMLGKCSDFSAM